MCEREEGCHSLSTACLQSSNGPVVSPAGILLSSSAATVVGFSSPIQLLRTAGSSFSHHLISPWKWRLPHVWPFKWKVAGPHGGTVCHSQQLADTQPLLCWDPICSVAVPLPAYCRGSRSHQPSSLHILGHQVRMFIPPKTVGNSSPKCSTENAVSMI